MRSYAKVVFCFWAVSGPVKNKKKCFRSQKKGNNVYVSGIYNHLDYTASQPVEILDYKLAPVFGALKMTLPGLVMFRRKIIIIQQ